MNEAHVPKEISQMRAGVNHKFDVRIRSFSVTLRPLSIIENIEVASNTAKILHAIPEAHRNRITEHTCLIKETLKMASTSGFGKTDYLITDQILQYMSADELIALNKQYVAGLERVNPEIEEVPIEELKKMVESVKKKDLALIELSFWQLVAMADFLLKAESLPQDK